MKKLIIINFFLLVAIFLAGCGQQEVGQNRLATTKHDIQQPIQQNTTTTEAIIFLEKYCQLKNIDSNIWECSDLYNYPGGPQKFTEDCNSIGYLFNCSGMCGSGQCYLLSSRNKTCTKSTDCESGWCKVIDENCNTNCTGKCSESFPPDQCSSGDIFTFKAIENGKIINKEAGGAICD